MEKSTQFSWFLQLQQAELLLDYSRSCYFSGLFVSVSVLGFSCPREEVERNDEFCMVMRGVLSLIHPNSHGDTEW
ncbi:uncharacterized protein G2W53_003843 [Senna tora]|uniref:Uncharacterized protein n=1 Tax=Senna tora TaxID=362788 RepID=A0A835CIS8_9FABA|nr:uncharacterized protein G2W53_003843 [Senna tora]